MPSNGSYQSKKKSKLNERSVPYRVHSQEEVDEPKTKLPPLPPVPKDLKDEGLALWKKCMEHLPVTVARNPMYWEPLQTYCMTWQQVCSFDRQIASDGPVIHLRAGRHKGMKPHPLIELRLKLVASMRSSSIDFFMTPKSQTDDSPRGSSAVPVPEMRDRKAV